MKYLLEIILIFIILLVLCIAYRIYISIIFIEGDSFLNTLYVLNPIIGLSKEISKIIISILIGFYLKDALDKNYLNKTARNKDERKIKKGVDILLIVICLCGVFVIFYSLENHLNNVIHDHEKMLISAKTNEIKKKPENIDKNESVIQPEARKKDKK